MGYLHINNLYKDQRVLAFKECYAMEKVHGTSAHVRWTDGQLHFFSGGEEHLRFKALFDVDGLTAKFQELGLSSVYVHGEAYGGKMQRMSETYGPELRFIAFDVKINDSWLEVPAAEKFVTDLGLEFVPYEKGPCEVAWLDAQRDRPSRVGLLRGCGERVPEGIVIRPLFELQTSNGERIIAKHKGESFKETTGRRPIKDPNDLAVLSEANAIADEWVTEMRLAHVLDKFQAPYDLSMMPAVLRAMTEDVEREGKGEIVESKAARKAITAKTAAMFKSRVLAQLAAA